MKQILKIYIKCGKITSALHLTAKRGTKLNIIFSNSAPLYPLSCN